MVDLLDEKYLIGIDVEFESGKKCIVGIDVGSEPEFTVFDLPDIPDVPANNEIFDLERLKTAICVYFGVPASIILDKPDEPDES